MGHNRFGRSHLFLKLSLLFLLLPLMLFHSTQAITSPASFICVSLFEWNMEHKVEKENSVLEVVEKRKMKWLVKEVEKEVRRKKEAETAQDSKIYI